jgi:hypothetical protein
LYSADIVLQMVVIGIGELPAGLLGKKPEAALRLGHRHRE